MLVFSAAHLTSELKHEFQLDF